jgi:hypothetical protein
MKIYIRYHDDCSVPDFRENPSIYSPQFDQVIDIPKETWERYQKLQEEFFDLENGLLQLIKPK